MIDSVILERLLNLQDLKYKQFVTGLTPTVSPDSIIGVRVPVIRSLAREMINDPDIMSYLDILPHRYYEENYFHSFIVSRIKNYDLCIRRVNQFLPYIDNWAVCDSFKPETFARNTDKLIFSIDEWINSEHEYTIRFGIEMLMNLYLGENYKEKYSDKVAAISSDAYYVNMMIAWYFATALALNYNSVIPYIEQHRLSTFVHNKTIQKAIESYRINDADKHYLRSLKISR